MKTFREGDNDSVPGLRTDRTPEKSFGCKNENTSFLKKQKLK